MLRVDLQRGELMTEAARRLVCAGAADGAVQFWRDGQHIGQCDRLYAAAASRAVEEPKPRFVPYHPHPMADISPLLDRVLAQEAAKRKDAAKVRLQTMED